MSFLARSAVNGPSLVLFLAVAATIALSPGPGASQTLPTLPQATVDTTMPTVTGTTFTVNAGGDLQAALNSAAAANPALTHQVVVQAGATFTGNFTLPARGAGSGWVIVRTSNLGGIPTQGMRAKATHASAMPNLTTNISSPIISNTDGSNRYRFVGIRFNAGSGLTQPIYSLIEMRGNNTNRVIFDRCLVDNPNNKPLASAMFALQIDSWAVIDSTFTNLTGANSSWETKAIGSWERSASTVLIQNNYLSVSAIEVLFGGGSAGQGIVISDITIRGNHFFKDLAWRGAGLGTKNHIELKLGSRILIEGNIFQNSWLDAQFYAMVFNAYDPVRDVTFRLNKVLNAYWLAEINGESAFSPLHSDQRLYFHDNLFDGYSGRGFLVWDGVTDVVIDHNTFNGPTPSGPFVYLGSTRGNNVWVTNNITHDGGYGIYFDGDGTGASAFNNYAVNWTSAKNVAVTGADARWSTGNFYPSSFSNVGFVNYAGGDYHLASSSPYKNAGTDGKDIGADITALEAATAGAISGSGGTTDTTPPNPPTGLSAK